MSVDYAAGLSDYDDLGVCGIDEIIDPNEEQTVKVQQLANWMKHFKGSCIVHVGAGISTAAGIPDFRGPSGVWTKKLGIPVATCKPSSGLIKVEPHEKQTEGGICDIKNGNSEKNSAITFDVAEPTFTHMALKKLIEDGYVSHIISQNVDGLFLKANLPRANINELHGNFYLDECTKCKSRYIRSCASLTMGLKKSNVKCTKDSCTGHLRDTILDWESPIPHNELRIARSVSKKNRLHICIGSTMQLMPANELPLEAKKKSCVEKVGKLVVINLQPIKLEQKADLSIHGYADEVMKRLTELLDVDVASYVIDLDPTKRVECIGTAWKK